MVACDVPGGMTFGTEMIMPIFTLSYPITYKVRFLWQKFFLTKGQSDQKVNTQIDKDRNT